MVIRQPQSNPLHKTSNGDLLANHRCPIQMASAGPGHPVLFMGREFNNRSPPLFLEVQWETCGEQLLPSG